MTPTHLALLRAGSRLVERLEKLEPRLDDGDSECWREYASLASALAVIAPQILPGAGGELLTTKAMAARLGVAPKTLLRRKARGEITPAVTLGARGRAAFRWAAR